MINKDKLKQEFLFLLKDFITNLKDHISSNDEWKIKGFVDIDKRIYSISTDTKILSKILEIHIFPELYEFAKDNNYNIILTDHQNYYPDISFVSKKNSKIKFAVDIKTTYRLDNNPEYCNGFTLGSHGRYFTERTCTKNIQFPYNDYLAHYCLGIIYSRNVLSNLDEVKVFNIDKLNIIPSVIKDFVFFAFEKWQIASDKSGSGNTANIGSIKKIEDIINGRGTFCQLGEEWFDDYWINFGNIRISDKNGNTKKINNINDFLMYRGVSSIKLQNNETK